ncbi:MAG: beta-glucosidase, partial [Clostridia bacterium]|nr:beta-glucosidase [Clostridia bacterium]
LGGSVRAAKKIYSFELDNKTVYRAAESSAPVKSFNVYTAKEGCCGRRNLSEKAVRTRTVSLKGKIVEKLPQSIARKPYNGALLSDVKNGKISMEEFVSMLDNNELEALTRGDYTMNSPLGAQGNAGAFGGVTDSLIKKGVPPVITTDGPSGIRLNACCSLIPIGTLLACTFDTALVEKVYSAVAREMEIRGSDVLLAPGMNIHRSPLCGRNFEYYSEDPLLTGKIAAAAVRGIQSTGLSACPKHFACNSQETNRNKTDSVLSERALREIYLRGFEICVREAAPKCIMTSYNKVNGVWSHYNYELCTGILRDEWGYGGCVITDWWMQYTVSPEFKKIRDNAYRVRSQVDVLMPGGKRGAKRKPDGTLLESLGKKSGITLGEIQRSAMNVLRLAMNKI